MATITEQNECEHKWQIYILENEDDARIECRNCPKKMSVPKAEIYLNEYETLKKATRVLLYAVVHSPVYQRVKDAYIKLRDIVEDLS